VGQRNTDYGKGGQCKPTQKRNEGIRRRKATGEEVGGERQGEGGRETVNGQKKKAREFTLLGKSSVAENHCCRLNARCGKESEKPYSSRRNGSAEKGKKGGGIFSQADLRVLSY